MCSFDSEVERHKVVLRDKPQPRFDTRQDWVNSNHRDAHHAEWAKAVAAAERRNHARKVREVKAKIRAAHDELAKLRLRRFRVWAGSSI